MRMKIPALILVATVTLMATAQAGGYRYRWVDGGGQMHFSDSLTAEAIKNGYDIINNQGLVVRHIERALTPQERAAREAQQQHQAMLERQAKRQHLKDEQMLSAYPTEKEYKQALQARINMMSQQVHTTEANMHALEQNLAQLLAKAAEMERNKKPVPGYLTSRIATRRKAIDKQRAMLQSQRANSVEAQREVDQKLEYYRQLRTKLATPSSR